MGGELMAGNGFCLGVRNFGWFPKGWFWRMFLGPPKVGTKKRNDGTKKRNDGTKKRNEGKKTERRYQKPEQGHIRQNRPFTKLPFLEGAKIKKIEISSEIENFERE